jgi:D-alanyl-D-alanine carboxypeptidase (penicillin-binding protein 5/6)
VVLARVLVLVVGLTVLPLAASSTLVALADEPRLAPGAHAAIVVDAVTGAVLYERNAREARHPASLTKMVTALVAVERAPLDRIVRVTHPIVVTPVLIGLEQGDELPLGEALYGLLLNSGNDAALAIAESVGDGSIERFVGWMNQTAERLGLQETHFKNPHGLDADEHLASAYDLAIIGRALMQQPALAKIVAQDRHEFDGPPRWVFRTRNPLLGVYDGVDGIKTGFDDLAGLCLVATATRDGRRAIAVVMDSIDYGHDAATLLDYAFADPRWGPSGPRQQPTRSAGSRLAMLRADLSAPGGDRPGRMLGSLQVSNSASRSARAGGPS